MAREKTDTAVIDPTEAEASKPQAVEASKPKLIFNLGRGKTGKSTLTRYMAERAFTMGRPVVIADGDRTNATLAAFFENVSRPVSPHPDDVTQWLNQLLEQQIEQKELGKPFSMIVDLGGGDLTLKDHARNLELVAFCQQFDIEPVAIHFLGTDLDDLAYLRDVEQSGVFTPDKTLLVLNEGVTPPGIQIGRAFDAIRQHEIFNAAIDRGALPVIIPRLVCMPDIDAYRQLFNNVANGTVKLTDEQKKAISASGKNPFGPINRQYTRKWLRDMEVAFSDAGVLNWLP